MVKDDDKDGLLTKTRKVITLSDDKDKGVEVKSTNMQNSGNKTKNNTGIIKKIGNYLFGSQQAIMETAAPQRSWSDEWPKYMKNYKDVYEKVSIVRKCINLIADFSISIGFDVSVENEELQEEIEKMRRRTNFSEVLKKAVKKREIWGNCAFHIKWDGDEIKDFIPLRSQSLEVIIDTETMEIDHFKYTTKKQGRIPLDKEDVLYLSKDALDTRKTGVSSLESIKTTINRKWNLEKDMEQASKRLWAPYTLFQYDTSYVKDKEEQKKEIKKFINKVEPGKTIVHNQKVEPEIIDMTPDLNALNTAIKSADEEIIGNWGIPKALLSRERTEDMSTLEFSIQTLYEGPIKSVQQYFSRELEKQVYERIAKKKGIDVEDINPEHRWKANQFKDSPTIRALTYAVKEQVISPQDMINMLGWNVDVDDSVEKREPKEPDERPITMNPNEFKEELRNKFDEEVVQELEDMGLFDKVRR